MFHRTVRQNVAFGRLDADDAEMQKAAEAANAAEFVQGLPQGYDNLVGERGVPA
jgi:ATP-binding cassette, subfamily B, bacterial